ncbi:MAG TPA: IPT/TIG domain-containing protein [Candidatus Dormibacteraeota bacterium]|nr:IPT/TIG domain-containing protein [Candidatus Dormibacteraeota bacterium]
MTRGLCAAWLLLIAALPIVVAPGAQSPVQSSPEQIVLPLELIAAEPATLAVLSPDGRVESGVKLVLSNGEVVTTDESGRAHFLGPPDAGILIARIPGTEICAAADVLHRASAEKLETATVPAMVALKDRFTVDGNGFSGDADRNQVELDGKPALVLTASPTELVILASSKTAPGSVRLAVKTGANEVSAQTTLVDVLPDTTHDIVRPGKKGKLVLHVSGTTQPVELDVQNMSPGIVTFKHGDRQHVRTHGGADNSATVEVKGRRAGDFSYAVTLEPKLGVANVEAARDFLQAADKLANGDVKRHIDRILTKLRSGHTDIGGARKEFAKISTANSASDLQALIRAAGEALNGESAVGREELVRRGRLEGLHQRFGK